MKKISIFFLVIVLLSCQDSMIQEPTSFIDGHTLASKVDLTKSLDGSLTSDNRNSLLSSLERQGHSLTPEQLDYFIHVIDAAIPVVYSRNDEMPASLRDANVNWRDIAEQDPVAAAFVSQVKDEIEDKITTETPVTTLSCSWEDLMFSIFMCIKSQNISCKRLGECDVTLGTISEFIECTLSICFLD